MPIIKYNDVSYGGGGGGSSIKTTYVGVTTSISEGVINVSCDEDFTPTDGTILSVAFTSLFYTDHTMFSISINGGDEVYVSGLLGNTTLPSGTLIFVYYHNINNVPMWLSLSTLFPIASVGGVGITSLTDSLTSDSVASALTAKQGKALNDYKADKSDLKPTTITLSNGSIYYHATRASGTGMEIRIPLAYAPTSVSGSGLKYYDNETWNDTAISGYIHTGTELIVTFTNVPSASGVYGMQGTINLTYA